MKLFKLHDDFDNGEINHFTHYDYMNQLIENGQMNEFKSHIKKLDNGGVISLANNVDGYPYLNAVRDEILRRMK